MMDNIQNCVSYIVLGELGRNNWPRPQMNLHLMTETGTVSETLCV
jgi:hypothetical protein